MLIDYIELSKIIDLRLKQIDDASKEDYYFNTEWNSLTKIREGLTEIILLERHTPEEYNLNKGLE